MDGEHPKRRRCCGMPLWVFLLSLTVIFCVCAAAIVLPLVLIVFKDKDEAPKQISALEICQRDAPCLNGGTSVLNASSCGCVCNNGFEGTRCEKQGSNGCKTVSYFGSEDGEEFNDVTIGSAIPRLVDQAGDMYSVPLAYEALVNQFGRLEVGCSEANALVTYNGDSGASDTDDKETEVSSSKSPGNAAATFTPTSTQGLGRRQGGVDTDILLATGTPKAPAISAAPTAAIAAPTDGPSASGPDSQAAGTNITVSSETLDFARIAVLYILQERSLSEAVDAQANLQSLLSTAELPEGETTGNATITGGLVTWKGSGGQTGTVDLGAWRVSLGNNAQNGDGVGGRAKGGVRAF